MTELSKPKLDSKRKERGLGRVAALALANPKDYTNILNPNEVGIYGPPIHQVDKKYLETAKNVIKNVDPL